MLWQLMKFFYGFLVFIYLGGLAVVAYHLITFKINRSSAMATLAIMVGGGLLLLAINFMCFLMVDWENLFDTLFI